MKTTITTAIGNVVNKKKGCSCTKIERLTKDKESPVHLKFGTASTIGGTMKAPTPQIKKNTILIKKSGYKTALITALFMRLIPSTTRTVFSRADSKFATSPTESINNSVLGAHPFKATENGSPFRTDFIQHEMAIASVSYGFFPSFDAI